MEVQETEMDGATTINIVGPVEISGQPPKQSCETCRFWLAGRNDGFEWEGVCRRYPPVVFGVAADDDGNSYSIQRFPTIYSDLWCGEYEE